MSLRDHAVSFGVGAANGMLGNVVSAGGIAASITANSHGLISETSTAIGVLASALYYGCCVANTACAADGAPFMKTYWDSDPKLSKLSDFKSRSFALGSTLALATPFALIYNFASKPPAASAPTEKATPVIRHQKHAFYPTEGATVYQSTSGPVTVPKGLKVG